MDEQYKFKKETLDLSKLVKCKDYVFDYEINNIKFEEEKSSDSNITLNSKMYYYDKDHHADRIVNYNNFKDCKFREPFKIPKNAYSASFLKHLVSKKKRRYQDSEFDLDMAYITDRVIAMGYPSVGLEAIYRNDVNDVIAFFEKKHKGNVKIYNLCLEKDRIYEKKLFLRSKVALFPSLDHNPCSVKLLLEFCVDICLFLILNLDSVAAVHCKAGKGRTGVMICCYLVFSGLCKNTDDAINYYGVMRTTNMKGVTIPSQKRYIKYFETFLKANFYAPYIYLIPKIIKEHLFLDGKPPVIKNLLINLKEDERYYTSPDKFRVNWIKIGPLPKEIFPTITIENFTHRVFKYPDMICSFKYEDNLNYNINDKKKKKNNEKLRYFFFQTEEKEYPIHTDIKIIVKGEIDFYICMNLWYSSLEVIDKFLLADYEEDNEMYSEANENNDDLKLLNKDKMTSLKSLSDYSIKNDINFSSQNKNNVKEDKYEIIDDTLCLNKNGFLIFNEDKMEIANNNKKDIDEIFNDKNSKNLKHTRPTFTSAIKHGSQLNTIISKLNENRKLSGKKEFDKNNVIINLTYDQLDKFKQKKTMKDLTVEICYSIE
jgi:phosphatidylinositol-3,4,5-trisphosphate 3-phosphatase/dual-specificity protein phosphatase PTEN